MTPDRAPPGTRCADGFFHDVRTSLTVIRLRTQLLNRLVERSPHPEHQQRLITDLHAIDAQVAALNRRLDDEQWAG